MFKKTVLLAIGVLFVSGSLLGGLCTAQQKKTLRSFRLSKQARTYLGTREEASSKKSMLRTSRYRKASSSAKKKAERSKTQQQPFRNPRKSK